MSFFITYVTKSCFFFFSKAILCLLSNTETFLGAIKRKVELEWGTEDTEYLQKVHTHVEGALNELKPDIIVYNAGTDILDGDPLGGLAISPQVCIILKHIQTLTLQLILKALLRVHYLWQFVRWKQDTYLTVKPKCFSVTGASPLLFYRMLSVVFFWL